MAAIKARLLIIKLSLGKAATHLAVPGLVSLAGTCVLLTQAWEGGLQTRGDIAGVTGGGGGADVGGVSEPEGISQVLEGLEMREGDRRASEGQPTEPLGDITDLFVFVFKYLSWWAALVWCLAAYCSMLVFRLGLNSGA
jgi:hypothetical protein